MHVFLCIEIKTCNCIIFIAALLPRLKKAFSCINAIRDLILASYDSASVSLCLEYNA